VPTASTVGLLRQELADQRRKVDFDTYDVTVDELIRRVGRKRIDIAPVYQRQFRWDKARQSRLIESVLLGIPVPPLFMATNSSEGVQDKWEVVDGLQRLLSLVNFAGDSETRAAASISDGPLVLAGLDKLARFDGCSYTELPEDVQSFLLDRPMKVVVLNDKSQLQVRYDLFERLNTGGITLTPQEIRESVFRGDFMEDYALRFFAFLESYKRFDHSVQDFLTTFVTRAAAEPRVEERRSTFTEAFRFLAGCFPSGLKTRKGQTPVNLYEGVAVGAALALKDRPDLTRPASLDWISSDEMRRLTTGATNSQPRVSGRIEYSRDRFLGRPA
jgi:hypothetical protein